MDVVQPTDDLCTAPPDAAQGVGGGRACGLHPLESLAQGAPAVTLQQQAEHVGPPAAVPPGVQAVDGEGGPLDAPHGLHLKQRLLVQRLDLQRRHLPAPPAHLVDGAEAAGTQPLASHKAPLSLRRLGEAGEGKAWKKQHRLSLSQCMRKTTNRVTACQRVEFGIDPCRIVAVYCEHTDRHTSRHTHP